MQRVNWISVGIYIPSLFQLTIVHLLMISNLLVKLFD